MTTLSHRHDQLVSARIPSARAALRWLAGMIALSAGAACLATDEPVVDEDEASEVRPRAERASCTVGHQHPVATDAVSATVATTVASATRGHIEGDPELGGIDVGGAGTAAMRLTTTEAEIDAALANATVPANGVPKWQSRPGATIALYLDFDGGTYDGTRYSAASLDSDKTRFSRAEQRAIIRAALEVSKTYAGFNVNVTTDRDKMDDAYRWGWILITNSWGSSGEAWIDVMDWKPTGEAMGIAGTDGVLNASSIDRGYLLTHELGHMFGLYHSGRWVNGSFFEYEELKESRTGDWLGGRDDYFTSGYRWRDLQTEESTSTQRSTAIITSIAGRTDCVASNPECTSGCPCRLNEARDCDSNSHCIDGLVCRERGSIDKCEVP